MWRRGRSSNFYSPSFTITTILLLLGCCLAPASSFIVVAPFTAAVIVEQDILVDSISHNTSSSTLLPLLSPPSTSSSSLVSVTTPASSLSSVSVATPVLSLPVELRKRQNNACPANYSPCPAVTQGAVCCSANSDCQRDQAGNIACCPRGASCTGIISVGTQTGTAVTATGGNANNGGFIVGGAGAGGGGGSATVSLATTGFVAPSTTASNPLISGQATGAPIGGGGAGYVGFLPIAAPFPNQQVCSSAYSSCQTEFQKCTAALGGLGNAGLTGGFNGITISGAPGIGITVQGASTTLGAAQATSVCQSLSSQACQGLQLVNCNVGTATQAPTRNAAVHALPTPWVGVGLGCMVWGVVEQVW
ncbi:MAG: hypothetical protein M1823_001192 [Watsoniomyces obsoletus]|nr:MAG: hypothetical protein M1823_001192 [Watsoniomyces obsoletus]